MIIDANEQIIGRLASFAAGKALRGERVEIINCEKAVVTGSKKDIILKYTQSRARGMATSGPYYPRRPAIVVRRAVRGMLPYNNNRGKNAYARLVCHIGTPEKLSGERVKPKNADVSKLPNLKYMYIGDVCKLLGAKW